MNIFDRLRDVQNCSNKDIGEAADMLEFLLPNFQTYSLDMGGQHSYRFRNGGYHMANLKGPNIEDAILNAVQCYRNENGPEAEDCLNRSTQFEFICAERGCGFCKASINAG